MMTEQIAIQLARGRNFSMPERIEMGLWPRPPIAYEWRLETIASAIERTRFFPTKPSENDPPPETGGPRDVQGERTFSSAREAAEWYLEWQLRIAPERLPARFDGWTVV